MSNEQHAQEFLEYVAKNEKRLKKNLRKNITYDPYIFDDVFQDSIIKVYDSIMNGTVIEDFEKYFFIASKFSYFNADNKNKRNIKQNDRDLLWNISHGYENNRGDISEDAKRVIDEMAVEDNEWEKKEDKNENINKLFRFISEKLNKVFSPAECDIYLIYFRLKSEKSGVSYEKMAKITGRSFSEISQIIQKVKKYVKNDDEINEMKKKLLYGNT
jgi:DNA-directed RNA polymerase specialized sigma24 family protein